MGNYYEPNLIRRNYEQKTKELTLIVETVALSHNIKMDISSTPYSYVIRFIYPNYVRVPRSFEEIKEGKLTVINIAVPLTDKDLQDYMSQACKNPYEFILNLKESLGIKDVQS